MSMARGNKLISPLLAVALVAGLSGCGTIGAIGAMNPFAEKEKRLPGERQELYAGADPIGDGAIERKLVAVPPARQNADWAQPGGAVTNNPGHLALASSGGSRAWSTSAGKATRSSGIYSSSRESVRMSSRPIAYQGRVYVYDPQGNVSSHSIAGGGRAWRVSLRLEGEKDPAAGGGLAADQGRIFAATGYGFVHALDPSNGREIWKMALEAPARSAPTVANGVVYVITQTNVVVALSTVDGSEKWSYRGISESAGLLAASSPAVVAGTVVVPYSSGEVMAIDAKTGKPRWAEALTRSYRTMAVSGLSDVSASPVIHDRVVIATGIAGRTLAINLKTGARIWEQDLGSAHTPAVTASAVYLVDLRDRVVALNRKDGKVMWSTQLPIVDTKKKRTNWAGPVLAGGSLWLVSNEGKLAAVDAASGEVRSTRAIGAPAFIAPIVASGKLFILSGNGTLTAVN